MNPSTVQGFLRIAEKFTPVLKNSKFKETGVLTPEEFVAAGEFLTYKCPTWSWGALDESKAKPYLPLDKQYLITRNVPCYRRVKDMEYRPEQDGDDVAGEDNEDWVATHSHDKQDEAIQEIEASDNGNADDDDENIPDIEDINLEDNVVEEDDPSAVKTSDKQDGNDHILKTRTYDITITYDKYYQTPRVWLFGYDEQRKPLSAEHIYQDISQDHAKKTVTFEPHSSLGISQASIHPCKHSNVMKKIIDHLEENGKELRVDQYLFLFLKFISSIIPTIEYDFTISMDG